MATPKPVGVCQGRGKPSTTPNNSTRVVGGAKRPFGNLVGGVEGVVSGSRVPRPKDLLTYLAIDVSLYFVYIELK